jgi:glycosyltransferase involved in cell wall biosynthesis
MMEQFPIAVVIPAYRAEAHIETVLLGIPGFVRYIVIVDDGSPDQTAARARRCRDPRVHLVSHAENQGVGGAMLTGYEAAIELGAEILVKMDSDGQMDPAYLLPLIAPLVLGEADYTKANRFLQLRRLHAMPLLRRVGNAGLSFLNKLASGYWNIFDPTNGYTAAHASVVRLLNKDAISRRYFFESSMLLELSLLRAVVRDISVPARYGHEVSSLSEWDALVRFPGRLLKGFLHRLLVQYFLRDFTAFSVFFLAGCLFTIFGFGWGAYHWYLSAMLGREASTGTVMIAVLPIILGTQFILQAALADIQGVPTSPLHRGLELTEAKIRSQVASVAKETLWPPS